MIESYNSHNKKKLVEKLAKAILKLYNHIIKKDIKIIYKQSWFLDNGYVIKFYNNSFESYNLIFWLKFDVIEYVDHNYNNDYKYFGDFDVKISLQNSNVVSHMIKCEDFLKYFKNILLPYNTDNQYYVFSISVTEYEIPDLILKLSIKEYDFKNDLKKFNL